MRLPSHVAGAAAVLGLLVASAAPALAHTTLDKRQVEYDVDVDLTFRAPIERQGTTNVKVEALLPGVFEVLGCTPRTGWTCDVDTTSSSPDTVVTWEAVTVGSPQDLTFAFRVRTPGTEAQGDYLVPVVQTYSDGHEAAWINDGEPGPAPRLRVGPESLENTETPPDAPPSPEPDPTPSARPTSSEQAPSGDASDAPEQEQPGGDETAPDGSSETPATDPTDADASAAPVQDPTDGDDGDVVTAPEATAGDAAGGESGGSALPIVLGVAVLAAAAGGAVLLRRRQA